MFYRIKPEVAGHLGNQSIIVDESARPPKIDRLHYDFDGWVGDDFLSTILTYIGTVRLAAALQTLSPPVSGLKFDTVIITKSEEYLEWGDLLPKELPDFVWFKVNGTPGIDDFGIVGKDVIGVAKRFLVVSKRVLLTLKSYNLNHCDIEEYIPSAIPPVS